MKILFLFASGIFLLVALGTSSYIPAIIGVALIVAAFTFDKNSGDNRNEERELTPTEKLVAIAASRKERLSKRSIHPPLLAVHLGGSGTKTPASETVYIGSTNDSLVICHATKEHDFEFPLTELLAIEVSGPGTETKNAGIIGGGFGLEGAVKGMIAAALVNAATTRTTTNTFLRITTSKSEALFHFNDQEPSTLRLTLSHLFVAAEANKASKSVSMNSISDEITKLQSLKEAGVLNEEEFTSAKQKLLS